MLDATTGGAAWVLASVILEGRQLEQQNRLLSPIDTFLESYVGRCPLCQLYQLHKLAEPLMLLFRFSLLFMSFQAPDVARLQAASVIVGAELSRRRHPELDDAPVRLRDTRKV
jgi:hypothetical protein